MWGWIGRLLRRGWRAYSELDTASSLLANFGIPMTGSVVTLWGYFAGLPGPVLVVILLAMLSLSLLAVVTWLGWWRAAEAKSTDGAFEQSAIAGHSGIGLDSVLRTDIEEDSVRLRQNSSALAPDMDMSDAVSLAAGEDALTLGNDLGRLNTTLTRIRQLAYQGEIQVWGKEITDSNGTSRSDIWVAIPRRYWTRKELLPVVIDSSYTGAHTIIDGAFSQVSDDKPEYTSTRVNREQFERAVCKDDTESLGVVLTRYLDEGWVLFNRVGKRRPDYRIVNLDGQTQHLILEWNRKVEQILEDSGMHKAKRDFMYYTLETTGELRVRVARLQQILENEIGQS